MRKRHHYGLGRIYEMVINNDPCYAYLQESNAPVDQKLVIAHVYGHCDFFKNNLWFSQTNRKMMDEMANHSTRVRKHIEKHGQDVVEKWLDVCLSIEHLIDPHSMFMSRGPMEMTRAEPRRLLESHGLEVVEIQPYGQDAELLPLPRRIRVPITDRLPIRLKDRILDRAGHQLAAVALKPPG